jgi:hypothetical protein
VGRTAHAGQQGGRFAPVFFGTTEEFIEAPAFTRYLRDYLDESCPFTGRGLAAWIVPGLIGMSELMA